MSNFGSFMLFLFATAVTQNVVLTTGFGSSMLLRIVRHPRDILPFSGILGVFSVLTVTVAYPLDALIGTDFFAKLLRPLMVVGIAAVLYLLSVLLLRHLAPAVYTRTEKMLPLAAFNNLVIGVALICNHSFALPLIGAVGLALGCCVGFTVLSLLTAEGLERLDSPDIPPAFRGLPATLIYIGLLALAILGFASSVSLI